MCEALIDGQIEEFQEWIESYIDARVLATMIALGCEIDEGGSWDCSPICTGN